MRVHAMVVVALAAGMTMAGCATPPPPGAVSSPVPSVSPAVAGDVVAALEAPVVEVEQAAAPQVTVSRAPEQSQEPPPAPEPSRALESVPAPAPGEVPDALPASEPQASAPDPEPAPQEPAVPTATELACGHINAARVEVGAGVVTCSYSQELADFVWDTWSQSGSVGNLSWRMIHLPTPADSAVAVDSLDQVGPALLNLGIAGYPILDHTYGNLRLACVQGSPLNSPDLTLWGCAFAMA